MKTSFRFFTRIIGRNPEAYVLKVVALSTALATSIAIVLFFLNEYGYDRFHENAGSVFRVIQKNVDESYSGNRLSAKIPDQIVEVLRDSRYHDSLTISRAKIMKGVNVLAHGQLLSSITVHAVDPNINKILTLSVLDGDVKNFDGQNGVKAVVSSQFAETHWGTSKVAGETLLLYTSEDSLQVSIAAVFKAFPENSHEKFNILITFNPAAIRSLNFNDSETGVYGRTLQGNPEQYRLSDHKNKKTYSLQPLTKIYFGPRVLGEAAQHGDRYSIITLVCITSLILFLALSTFINLTTITLPHRSKELAVRKLAGTTQEMLLFVFIKESAALVGISLFAALLLLISTQQFIESILGFRITSFIVHADPNFALIVALLLFILTVSPVFMTLRFIKATPVRLLSTDTITFPSLKRYITFIQLGISIFLIIASAVVRRQINYSLVKEPGQNHDQIVYLNSPQGITNEGVRALRNGWRISNPNIVDVMAISQLPDRVSSREIDSKLYRLTVDQGFRDFFNLRMEEGYWFGPNSSDSSIVINKTAKENLRQFHTPVLGVMQDINGIFNLPEKPVRFQRGQDYGYHWLCVRVLEVDIRRTVSRLSNQFSTPGETAHVNYLSDHFKSWIDYQDRLNRLSWILTLIAASLSCCTIYGLSMSLVRDKLKQIAVHKLFGANTFNITMLLVIDFARQLAIALIVFLPLSYMLLHELLRTFVYATHFSWLDPVYPLVYCVVIIVSICTFQAWNLKRMNSIAALKG